MKDMCAAIGIAKSKQFITPIPAIILRGQDTCIRVITVE
jgi:hypothetical protein